MGSIIAEDKNAKAGVNARQVAEENCNAWVIGI